MPSTLGPHWDVVSKDGKKHKNVVPGNVREKTKNSRYLTCKRIYFFSMLDEHIFFFWINNIPCIEKFEAAKDELYLDLVDKELDYDDMKDLIALFFRYKIDMKQLAQFVNNKNKAAILPWKNKILFKK